MELSKRAESCEVSAALHRQLVALATTASAAAPNPQSQDEASALYDMLLAATELADGIEHNTGIDAAARLRVELQLTESLALYTDVRTRSAGRNRIASLSQYRDTLLRVQRLRLPAGLAQRLAPVFIWVNNNPESGGKVLESIERDLQPVPDMISARNRQICPPIRNERLTSCKSSSSPSAWVS